ncbi:MAG: hypothetical protein A3I61_18205 [Acidobacteria bacterium RIFCSPLOWO2_02_FULL_68_18]|nr:MAG: hypothetical protein A3I61_18205 [Acidobacteria bacterium RIFCSPLOWO2_02_FULL_68_18]OFW49621.1 MAG: hypothetical protein A3G77_16255 [Acidobacteria bacterium RIFCSPLOWO2_12_FULL_68_19]
MQKRSGPVTVLTLLLATFLAAALLFWTIDRRSAGALAAAEAVTTHLDRMRDAIAEIGAAQQSYVAPGQLDEPWFERTATLVGELRGGIAAVQPRLRSEAAAAALQGLAESLDALEAADARTRQNLSLGQELMAADVIFSDGRNLLDGMAGRLRDLRHAERGASSAALATDARARWATLALLALTWVGAAGAFWRARPGSAAVPEMPRGPRVPKASEVRPDTAGTPGSRGTLEIDLSAAAALCTDLSRVTDTAALAALLGRTASVLDASGVLLWMSAGEQLFAVLGHGYAPEHLGRFGPIACIADNAAAAAWRTGRLSVVAGDGTTSGGLVAPMFGPSGCIGVLALEIRHGREQEPAAQAVAAMVAAQLATAVAAWPAASVPPAGVKEPAARTA